VGKKHTYLQALVSVMAKRGLQMCVLLWAGCNINQYELVVMDNNAQEVIRQKVNAPNINYTIDLSNFSSGVYFYTLCTKQKSYQSGKFILEK
jgi:hypothetical protein